MEMLAFWDRPAYTTRQGPKVFVEAGGKSLPQSQFECALDAAQSAASDPDDMQRLYEGGLTFVFAASPLYCKGKAAHACANYPVSVALNSNDPDAIRALAHELHHIRCWGREPKNVACWDNASPEIGEYAPEIGPYLALLVGCK
jgi:hypothetical protein